MKKHLSLPILACCAGLLLNGCGHTEKFDPKNGFDVPSLVGLDLKGVLRDAGYPESALMPDPRRADIHAAFLAGQPIPWNATWKHGTAQLKISYDANTLQVHEFFLSAYDPDDMSSPASDIDHLRVIGHLAKNELRNELRSGVRSDPGQSGNYSVTPVPAPDRPDQYAGLKIVPR